MLKSFSTPADELTTDSASIKFDMTSWHATVTADSALGSLGFYRLDDIRPRYDVLCDVYV